jgi:hypothetical protein
MNAPLRTAALLCLALPLHLARAQGWPLTETRLGPDRSPAELKQLYLACDQAATAARLSMADAIHCSIVSEELKQRVFQGDFNQLLAWWKTQRSEPSGR